MRAEVTHQQCVRETKKYQNDRGNYRHVLKEERAIAPGKAIRKMKKGESHMTPDELWIETGAMLSRSQREDVEPGQAKERFDVWLQRKAAGGSPEDLSIETVYALGDVDAQLPDDLASLLGLELGASYGEVFEAIHSYELACK